MKECLTHSGILIRESSYIRDTKRIYEKLQLHNM